MQPGTEKYFSTPDLSGPVVLERSDPELSFDWHLDSPAANIPVDYFSARWTRSVYFPAGQYRFNVTVDDGVRLYVDGQIIIDQWRITAPITYTSSISLVEGNHDLRVEYYENTERAQIKVWWDQGAAPVAEGTPVPADHPGTWHGKYFNNRDLSGDPTFERDDGFVYFDWGTGGPGGGIGGQNYSVRWYRMVDFTSSGRYQFKITADDGVRLWLDWAAIIDQWHDNDGTTYTVEKQVSKGQHELVVEYYQADGPAEVKLGWQDASQNWIGNISTCMRPQNSWIKVYRLAPNNQWEDLKPEGYGPLDSSGVLKLFGVSIDASYGWDGQPFMVELWANGVLVRSEGDIFAGQPAFRLHPDQTLQTSWPCGADIP